MERTGNSSLVVFHKLIMNISCDFNEQLSLATSVALSLWLSLTGLAAVIGNAVVLWLFYKNESLRTISNRFLASLCVADFLVGLMVDPMYIAIKVLAQPRKATILLKANHMMWIHSTAATVFNLCCVSVDRFIAIRFPFRYHDIITKQRCYAVIIIVWLISLLLPFSRILVDDPTTVEDMWFSLSFIVFVLPITVVTFCYFWIFQAVRKQMRKMAVERHQNSAENNTPRRARQNHKAIKTIGFVLGVFIVSWMPSLVISVVSYAAADECLRYRLEYVVWPWIAAIGFTSSAINPWIYVFFNGEFRDALRRCFHWFSSDFTPEFALEQDRNQRMP